MEHADVPTHFSATTEDEVVEWHAGFMLKEQPEAQFVLGRP